MMELAASNALAGFIDELSKAGVKHVVICPGSRSTPLALLFTDHPGIQEWVLLDERSAGFFALGIAKKRQEAVVLLCTSGTAASNYLPAVTEAFYSNVPLVVLTADRPPELRDVGAPQAINQPNMFANFIRWQTDLPVPDEESALFFRVSASRAIHVAQHKEGPVHINVPLREPLIPHENYTFTSAHQSERQLQYIRTNTELHSDEADAMMRKLSSQRTLVIWGPDQGNRPNDAFFKTAEALNWPVLADPLSQLRHGGHEKNVIIDQFDNVLRTEQMVERLQPDVIIRLGVHPVSKALQKSIVHWKRQGAQYIVWDQHSFNDPTLSASHIVEASSKAFVHFVNNHHTRIQASEEEWIKRWKQLQLDARRRLCQYRLAEPLQEDEVFPAIYDVLDTMDDLFVGNSMPIRDCDSFLPAHHHAINIWANRGANGIDGVISTALGVSAAGGNVLLVIGDISTYHDLNGLLAGKKYALSMTILIVHNDGGGIFSFLPQKTRASHYQLLFETPHGLDFSHAAALYGASYQLVHNASELQATLREQPTGMRIVVVNTDQETGLVRRREKWRTLHMTYREGEGR
ncbi:2-succinyl-5-enolpyruvyl-6-hydroxy-3-cyclohexene-1-carboxylic-acid synthase [Aureibacillus halotolerans]|uniref:2-succinyl-5-enolpyruvyl-6-hydroxy-3-cyclohexene-1-carboxylate synthase n=1 Tax=Aureibacillus halotolerans TaxID=1508390 RepID=A0A4R6U6Z0_9BACI|nr:2-succinyl-5-enolpyruvyl-6-hydroxy-3-cyclohexene-1-carboxylic-acid synthase [Aureibacillus halotolerans]TDQ40305.1 2-succinyl-5-enolpyruvyl-6-hydroxy-3-cyclohexene-1-carboxylate synthase [Aureibacillus halotolerans]